MPSAEDITIVVNRYIDLVSKGSPDELAEMYADDAVLEDPVGGDRHIGRDAIRGFYAVMDNVDREAELVDLRVGGHEAVFHFTVTVTAGDSRTIIDPIEVMVFDDDVKIRSMKAYWSPDNVTQL